MNSSMLAGERRWASARRGGMTVLGKVAVPKPLNLPSQKLENHGLDPNVEIVPKGTLSWGSRPSSSGSNPWITSSVSPNAEGGTVSPSHHSGRPSSGGSGTRPSTAGSERTHQPVSNAWGSNSRPSSASGTLSSNQASLTLLRPRSAENRPNSSQLSRFADPVSKNSAAWGPSGTAGRSIAKFSKDDEFALTSGEFPTLGSEKDNSIKNTEVEEPGRPSSASCRIAHGKEDKRSKTDAEHGAVDTWRADGFQGVDDGIHPNMEKRNGDDPPQYFNPNTAPQHFDTWAGPPPMNGPAGVWYGRGRPQGPPYRVHPVQPGGFPMEPFPYYRPQIPPPPLPSSQSGPIPGPRGPHPKNGDLYRPQMPDAYAYPGMPFRPGFYPAPPGPRVPQGPLGPIPFEGYYGPPLGSERDIPYMGMAAPPPVYNSTYPVPGPGIGNSHGQNVRGHRPGKTSSEQVDGDRMDTQGPKRIHLKSHHNQHDHTRYGDTWEHNPQPDISYPNKNRQRMVSSHDNVWDAEEDTKESAHAKGLPSENPPRSSDHRVHSMDGVKVKSFEGMGNAKTVHDNWMTASESVPSIPAEMSRKIFDSEKDSSILTGSKNSFLMHKIDGLNAKIRISDGRNVSPHAHNREKERNRSQVMDAKVKNNMGEVIHTEGLFERTPRDFASGPNKVIVPASDKPLQQVTVMSRRPDHGGQGRIDHRNRDKFNNQDSDGWLKKPLTAESFPVITASHDEYEVHDPKNVEEVSEYSVSNPVAKIEETLVDMHDSSDAQMKRAKMREIAKQRALQLQKEEEERIKEQRAKALAKLEELNRRTLAGEVGVEKPEKGQVIIENLGEQDESPVVSEPVMANINNANQSEESMAIMPRTLPAETDVTSLPMREDARDVSARTAVLQFTDGGTSRHKRTSYKQKLSNSLQKSFSERPVSHVATIDIKPNEHPSSEIKSSESNVPGTVDIVAETPMPQRRKNNRSGKNKHKLDETPLPPVEADINTERESIDKVVIKGLDTSVAKSIQTDKAAESQEGLNSSLNEESHGRIASQWRPHLSHRQPRSQQQANKKSHGGDSVWTPVSMQNKDTKASVEAGLNFVHESAYPIKGTNHTAQNNLKGKRAEMERYVPKPVAKELAQHGNVPNLSPSSSRLKDGSAGEINKGDVAHEKHTKDHGTWNQTSSHLNCVHNGPSSTYEPVKEVQEPKEISESVQGEIDTASAEIRTSGTGRGKRNVARSPATRIGNNVNPDKTFGGVADGNQTDRTIGPKENRASSHWKPKLSSNAANDQSLTTEINRSTKERRSHTTGQGDNSRETQPGQPVHPIYRADRESTAVGLHPKIEKKAKGQLYLPNLHPVGPHKSPPPPVSNEGVHVECNVRSGSRRNSRHNSNHLITGEDNNNARGDWNLGHDNMPRNGPPFMDNRQRRSTHYEYQPVGASKSHNRLEKVVELADGADSSYGKRRERGPSNPRRGGNYSRRQTGPPTEVDLGWE